MVKMWHFFYSFWSSAVTKRFLTFLKCSEEILSVGFLEYFRFGPSSSRTQAKADWSWWHWRWWWLWFVAPLPPKLQTALARVLKTKTCLGCKGQNFFRKVEKSWKIKLFGHSRAPKKIKKTPYFDQFPCPGGNCPMYANKRDHIWSPIFQKQKQKTKQHQPLVCSSFSIGWSLIDKRWCLAITMIMVRYGSCPIIAIVAITITMLMVITLRTWRCPIIKSTCRGHRDHITLGGGLQRGVQIWRDNFQLIAFVHQ